MSLSPYLGVPCEWTWEQLQKKEVTPPFKPILVSLNQHVHTACVNSKHSPMGPMHLVWICWYRIHSEGCTK